MRSRREAGVYAALAALFYLLYAVHKPVLEGLAAVYARTGSLDSVILILGDRRGQ